MMERLHLFCLWIYRTYCKTWNWMLFVGLRLNYFKDNLQFLQTSSMVKSFNIQHPPDVEMATQPQHEPTPAVHEGDQQLALSPPPPPPTQDGSPDWCKCGRCQNMPTPLENRCCTGRRTSCITTTPLFRQLVLDANVLELAMRYREDVMVMDHARNNENFRHTAYRQYVLWQHGRLGKGNRRVVPSCCVMAIRLRYPSPNGLYTGFRPTRL